MESRRLSERRKFGRYRKALKAVCQVDGLAFQARTYDISQRGITLLTGPSIPKRKSYLVQCWLPQGNSAIFEVEERQRRELNRGSLKFLRLGLVVENESTENLSFFRELARTAFPETPHPTALHVQLPAYADANGMTYRCYTQDFTRTGLNLQVPKDFPNVGIFPLTCTDSKGESVQLTLHERYRRASDQADALTMGCDVLGAQDIYQSFMERNCSRNPLR